MQIFNDPNLLASFKESIGHARFSSYLNEANQDTGRAVALYFWNSRLAGEAMFALQMFEVCLRNRLSNFLSRRYGDNWPRDPRALRQLTSDDRRRLTGLIAGLQSSGGGVAPSTDRIVSELSLGFWVSLLTRRYVVPFGWHGPGLRAVFPNDHTLTQPQVYRICNSIRVLRNRAAHHEPLFRLPMLQIRIDLDHILGAMCYGSQHFANAGCRMQSVIAWKP